MQAILQEVGKLIVQALVPNTFDWGMLTAICSVIALGGEILRRSMSGEVRKQLEEHREKMKEEFAGKEVTLARHSEHDFRIRALESNFPPTRRSHIGS